MNLKQSRRSVPGRTPVDRLPPHSLEAEQGVLGCVLLDPTLWLPEAEAKLPMEAFYDLRHRKIFEHMSKLVKSGRALDLLTLTERLIAGDQLEAVGGSAYLAALPEAVPSAANFNYYADILCEKFTQRRMVQTCTEAVSRIYESNGDADQVLDEIERDVLLVAEQRQSDDRAQPIGAAAAHIVELTENYRRGIGLIDGIRTGYGYLDKVIGGLHPGEVIILAARPSVGKTSLAMNIAENIAFDAKLPVGVLSMEMSAADLALRVMCARRKINFHHVRTGFASAEDLSGLKTVAAEMAAVPIIIDDTPALEVLQLRAKARRLVKRFGARVLFIDYLQLAHSKRATGQTEHATHVSNAIKAIARDLNIPVVAISQLSREFEKEGNRKPRLSDLRDSGALEQDADVVIFVYLRRVLHQDGPDKGKPVDYHNKENENIPLPVNLLIAKQRNGPSGTEAGMLFFRQHMRFEDEYGNRGVRKVNDCE